MRAGSHALLKRIKPTKLKTTLRNKFDYSYCIINDEAFSF